MRTDRHLPVPATAYESSGTRADQRPQGQIGRLLGLLVCCLHLCSCSETDGYEFPSCDQHDNAILTLSVPKSYWASGDGLVKPQSGIGQSFVQAYLFTTYPEFDALSKASDEQKRRTEAAMGNAPIPSAWVSYGNGIEFYLARDRLRGTAPEESSDGKYWVYPDSVLRAGKPSYDGMNNYLPKDTDRNVLIRCADRGVNSLPSTGFRCYVLSLMVETPDLSCVTVGFRIPPEDLGNWRERDAQLKRKLRSMISRRPK